MTHRSLSDSVSKSSDPVSRELATLRTDLRRNPRNLDSAVKLATRYIEQGRSEGDPRFLGQAQAVLSPWWNEPTPLPAALLLRATIRQNAHEFDQALTDLDQVLAVQPTNAQAWLIKASILQVQARYDEARRACQRLARLAASHVLLGCLGDIAGVTGQSAKSLRVTSCGFTDAGLVGRERIWIATILAETAARIGAIREAEQAFAEAFTVGVKDQYVLGAYADFLLDQRRYRDVISLLQHETKADGLLLRLALAEQALKLPTFQNHTAELAARFAASPGARNRCPCKRRGAVHTNLAARCSTGAAVSPGQLERPAGTGGRQDSPGKCARRVRTHRRPSRCLIG